MSRRLGLGASRVPSHPIMSKIGLQRGFLASISGVSESGFNLDLEPG